MSEEDKKKPTATEVVGAGEADLNPSEDGSGNPAPAEPSNKPPVEDPDNPDNKSDDTPDDDQKDDAEGSEDEPENKDDAPLDTSVWGSTGDEAGDAALTLMQNAGMTVEEAKAIMFDAVQAGDLTKVDRDALIEKVGKDKATLILAGAENFVSRSKAKAETITKEVHTAVGGEDNWNAVTTWANENVPADELGEYRDLIDAGGAKARFAAQELVSRFNGDSNNTTLDTSDITPDTKADTQGRALTRAQYVSELEAAHDRGASQTEINEINAARARGRSKGI